MLLGLGFNNYFVGVFATLESAVAMASLMSIIFLIIRTADPNFNGEVAGVFKIVRIARILRPLKMLKFMPSLTYQGSVLPSIFDLLLNIIIPLLFLVCFALVAHSIVGDAMTFRCVPKTDEDGNVFPSVEENVYYQEFGIDYFYSESNAIYCGAS